MPFDFRAYFEEKAGKISIPQPNLVEELDMKESRQTSHFCHLCRKNKYTDCDCDCDCQRCQEQREKPKTLPTPAPVSQEMRDWIRAEATKWKLEGEKNE